MSDLVEQTGDLIQSDGEEEEEETWVEFRIFIYSPSQVDKIVTNVICQKRVEQYFIHSF